eukprot:PhM_4_TR17035/c0_g1_i1/m.94641
MMQFSRRLLYCTANFMSLSRNNYTVPQLEALGMHVMDLSDSDFARQSDEILRRVPTEMMHLDSMRRVMKRLSDYYEANSGPTDMAAVRRLLSLASYISPELKSRLDAKATSYSTSSVDRVTHTLMHSDRYPKAEVDAMVKEFVEALEVALRTSPDKVRSLIIPLLAALSAPPPIYGDLVNILLSIPAGDFLRHAHVRRKFGAVCKTLQVYGKTSSDLYRAITSEVDADLEAEYTEATYTPLTHSLRNAFSLLSYLSSGEARVLESRIQLSLIRNFRLLTGQVHPEVVIDCSVIEAIPRLYRLSDGVRNALLNIFNAPPVLRRIETSYSEYSVISLIYFGSRFHKNHTPMTIAACRRYDTTCAAWSIGKSLDFVTRLTRIDTTTPAMERVKAVLNRCEECSLDDLSMTDVKPFCYLIRSKTVQMMVSVPLYERFGDVASRQTKTCVEYIKSLATILLEVKSVRSDLIPVARHLLRALFPDGPDRTSHFTNAKEIVVPFCAVSQCLYVIASVSSTEADDGLDQYWPVIDELRAMIRTQIEKDAVYLTSLPHYIDGITFLVRSPYVKYRPGFLKEDLRAIQRAFKKIWEHKETIVKYSASKKILIRSLSVLGVHWAPELAQFLEQNIW